MLKTSNKQGFETFLDLPVKVIVEDLGKPHFIRGHVKKVTEQFIFIEGDFSLQAIPISSIIKMTALKGEKSG